MNFAFKTIIIFLYLKMISFLPWRNFRDLYLDNLLSCKTSAKRCLNKQIIGEYIYFLKIIRIIQRVVPWEICSWTFIQDKLKFHVSSHYFDECIWWKKLMSNSTLFFTGKKIVTDTTKSNFASLQTFRFHYKSDIIGQLFNATFLILLYDEWHLHLLRTRGWNHV